MEHAGWVKKQLTGSFELDYIKKKILDVEGHARLKKDPRSETINFTNLIFRGDILLESEWVFGIAI